MGLEEKDWEQIAGQGVRETGSGAFAGMTGVVFKGLFLGWFFGFFVGD